MYFKILRQICNFSHRGMCVNERLPNPSKTACVRQMAYFWGHDTLEEKAERKRKVEESRVRNKSSVNCIYRTLKKC